MFVPADPPGETPTIADPYIDLLGPLSEQQRRAIVVRLTVGFYEGWRPSRTEVADLVAVELGFLTIDEALDRQQQRRRGHPVMDYTGRVLAARHHRLGFPYRPDRQ